MFSLSTGLAALEAQSEAAANRSWLPEHVVNKLAAMRDPTDSYSNLIVRLAKRSGLR
jgi:hypothetical protein